LQNIIPTNKPNVEPKRQSRPVNLTATCQPPKGVRDQRGPHQLEIEWTADKRAWAFAIYIVRHNAAATLLKRLIENPEARRAREHTQRDIVKRLNNTDGEGIEMETQRVSLLCPVSWSFFFFLGLPLTCYMLKVGKRCATYRPLPTLRSTRYGRLRCVG
jgi:hypothetical protein